MSGINALARGAELVDWRSASPEEVKGGLSLLYQQSHLVSAVLLVSADGKMVGTQEPVYLARGQTEVGGHPGFDAATGSPRLLTSIPLEPLGRGNRGQVALSPAYPHSLGQMAAVSVAVKLDGGMDSMFALAELGLGSIEQLLRRYAEQGARVDLVDGSGRVIASSDPAQRFQAAHANLWQAIKEGGQARFIELDEPVLVSTARVPEQLGMHAVVSTPARVALAPVRTLRRTALLSVSGALGLLMLVGFAFSRRLTTRLSELADGAEAFSRGELSRRIEVHGSDELADLSQTFNRMGAELESARTRLTRWNDDLRQKVEEATAELRAAQAELLEAQKLAAIGQLGAGVAHEINNPLCGILGNAQLLMLSREESDSDFETLRKIEVSAKRCKDITQNLLRFSQLQHTAGAARPTDFNAVVRDAVAANRSGAQESEATVALALHEGPLMVRGDPAQLAEVVQALLANARTAVMKSADKTITVTTRQAAEEVVLDVVDTGKGIKPEHLERIFEPFFTTKDVWSNIGLGLSLAYRLITGHQGRVEVESKLGEGALFRVRLPKLAEAVRPSADPKRGPTVGGQGIGITG
jgi:signal transduction histidine kinase